MAHTDRRKPQAADFTKPSIFMPNTPVKVFPLRLPSQITSPVQRKAANVGKFQMQSPYAMYGRSIIFILRIKGMAGKRV
jgi:hypothetical protein